MEIKRQGTNRRTGWSVIKSKKDPVLAIEGDSKKNLALTMTLQATEDPTLTGQYDLQVRLSLKDIKSILAELSDYLEPELESVVGDELAGSVRQINRLLYLASGVALTPQS